MKRHEVATKRLLVAVSATLLLAAGLALAPGASAQTAVPPGAVIDNGTIQLGVHDTANLNFTCTSDDDPGCPGPEPSLTNQSAVGLRFMQYNADGTAPGCLCEGWGAADATSGLAGWANQEDDSGGGGDGEGFAVGTQSEEDDPSISQAGVSFNMTVDSFTATASTATSVVTISNPDLPGYEMQVTHEYQPASGTPNLYEVLVTIENTGTLPLTDVLYRRVMDWDVEPTAFLEWVTIQGATDADNLVFDSDDGFASANPLSGPSYIDSEAVCGDGYTGPCDFADLGEGGTHPDATFPDDHGALFDFEFGSLDTGEGKTFRILYGAAASESAALSALGAESVEIYSLGQPNCPVAEPDGGDATPCASLDANSGVEGGEPVTFMFAFAGVGGEPVLPSIAKTADASTTEAGGQNGYTISITNPSEESGEDFVVQDTMTFDSITDTLPAGFSYVPGSTTGDFTTDDPTIVGQTLTWDNGPFSVPSLTTHSLHFNATVSDTPGQYFNEAAAQQTGGSELSTGPTAPIDVTATQAPPQGPPPALPLPCDPITAEGGPGGDRMVGGIGADRIRSLAGRDIVDAGAGNDEICGGEGGDFLYGRADSDIIRGEGGNDRLFGGLHPDTLYGDAGHDALIGGKGADSFFTQDGVKDCIMTGKGNDTVTGDVGLDLVDPRGGCPPGF